MFLAYFGVIYSSIFIIYRISLQAALIKLMMLFLTVLSNANNCILVGVNYMLENHQFLSNHVSNPSPPLKTV
jgi:hypothetical protein